MTRLANNPRKPRRAGRTAVAALSVLWLAGGCTALAG